MIGESGKLYLAAMLDLFSRFIVGWAVSAVNDRHLTIKALEMAVKRRGPDAGLLHHSDQGCTYASEDYQTILDARGITCSMSRRGNCHDNAVMEAFFSSLKSELADRFESCGDAKMALFDYIEVFYNQRRRHSTIGYVSPAAFERRAAARQEPTTRVPRSCTGGYCSLSQPTIVVPGASYEVARSTIAIEFSVRPHSPGGARRHPHFDGWRVREGRRAPAWLSTTADEEQH